MGLTETVAPSFSNPYEPKLRKLGALGKASGCEACVIDADLTGCVNTDRKKWHLAPQQ